MRLFLLTALAMLAFAANSLLNRLAVGGGQIDPVSFAVLRLAAGAAMLGLLVLARRLLAGGVLWPGWAGRAAGAGGLLVYLFGFSAAYLTLGAGAGALILFGTVQITMFSGALIAREAVPPARWAGAALALAGLVLLSSQGGGVGSGVAAGAMALAGVGWGVYSLAGRATVDPLGATAANFLLALPVGMGVWALAPDSTVSAQGVALAVASGAVTSGLGYALWYALVPGLGAARAGVAQLTVPMLAAAAGVLLLDEALSLRFLAAAALVLGGVALASLGPRQA